MTNLDFIPPMYRDNPTARRLILEVDRKRQREGKYVGYWSQQFSELTGIQPADDREYGEPVNNQEQD